jgi:hypothetical protein
MASMWQSFKPAQQMATFIRRLGGANTNPGSLASYDAGKGADQGGGIFDVMGSRKGWSEDELANDPLYALDLQIADARYPSGGGDSVGAKLAAAAAKNAYGGPSIESLQNWGNQGQARISDLYGQLASYLTQQSTDTGARFAQGSATAGAAYDKAQADIQAAQQQAAANIAAEASTGSAGKEAAAAGTANAKAAIDRQTALNQTNKANSLAGFSQLGAGYQGMLNEWKGGAEKEKVAQSGKLSDQVNSMIAKAQADMAQAAARTAAAQQSIRASAGGSGDRNTAERLKALKDAVKRAQSGSDKGDNLSGIQGVLAYAKRQGNVPLAKKFMDMYHAAHNNATMINEQASKDKILGVVPTGGGQVKTTWQDEFNKLLDKKGGNRQDVGDQGNADLFRGELFNQIKTTPQLAALKKYIVTNPDQARKLGLYEPGFGMSQEQYEKGLGRPLARAKAQNVALGSRQARNLSIPSSALNQQFINQMNQRFTPFVNVNALRGNQADLNTYYGAFDQPAGEQDLLATMMDIFQGRYGKGKF